MSAITRSRFYPIFAVALMLVVFVGFARTYYLKTFFDVPPLTLLMHLHGIVFSAWLATFVIQTRLIAAHNVQAHMKFGIAGLVIAFFVVVIGTATVFMSASAPRLRGGGLPSHQFVFVPFFILIAFTSLVTAAVLLRRRAALHKRLMTLAMIAVLPPATARLIALADAREHFLLLQTSFTAVFVLWCLIADWVKHRVVHPVYAIGGTLLVLSWPFRLWFAQTDAWSSVGLWMATVGKNVGAG